MLILLCVLAGCFPKRHIASGLLHRKPAGIFWISRWKSCRSRLPIITTITSWDANETTDEEIISEILQALRETTIVSKAFSGSTDSRILEFETADGDTCLFWLMKTGSMAPAEHPMCFRRRGDLGSGAENSGNISGIQGSDGVKRQIEKAGCSLLVCS